MNRPCMVCRPGIRCQACRERSIAHHRFMRTETVHHLRAGRPSVHQEIRRHTDPILWADLQTSLHDCRAALCLAMGVPVEWIDPTTGHDRTPTGQLQLAGVA